MPQIALSSFGCLVIEPLRLIAKPQWVTACGTRHKNAGNGLSDYVALESQSDGADQLSKKRSFMS